MSLQTLISTTTSRILLNPKQRDRARAKAERRRRQAGRPHEVEFFHQVDDPYSHLLAQALLELVHRYEVEVCTWLVPPPDGWAAPERERLNDYALRDAKALAERSGFAFEADGYPDSSRVDEAHEQLLGNATDDRPSLPTNALHRVVDVGGALWSGELEPRETPPKSGSSVDTANALAAGAEQRTRRGHYLAATCWYAGEWIWGIDRLAYLEERLRVLGAVRDEISEDETLPPIYAQPISPDPVLAETAAGPAQGGDQVSPPDLHFFLSFRSPYTYIVTSRVIELARVTGAQLQLRFVLPMVMRGLPIQKSKRFYLLHDAAREAERAGVPFGPIADPVGRAVERGYSLLPWAIEQGRGPEYCMSFMTHVWSRGLDAARDRGLALITADAGLDWNEARRHVDDPSWQPIAEANRVELLDLGLWGVPSFRVGDLAAWGQDRLWRVEEALRSGPSAPAPSPEDV